MSKPKDNANLENKVNELVKEVGGLTNQESRLAMLTRKAQENHRKLQESVSNLQESLDYLRVCIKYQIFDLEATRRENKYLRKLLEDKNK